MNEDVKQAWINALESGEYRQGRSSLIQTYESTDQKSFCCLGVLCDLAAKAGVTEYKNDGKQEGYSTAEGFETATLPVEVCLWAGLEENNPFIVVKNPYTNIGTLLLPIANINDNGMAFKEIANYIRKQL